MAEARQQVENEYVEQVDGSGTLEAITRGEIDTQIRTAKAFPRSIKKFLNEATDMACLNEQIAESCIYALPRAGKTIEGPSARLAEIVASAWGNCRAGARVVAEESNFIVAQGVFLDLERNVAITFETKRRITDRMGRRFADDMIVVTSNAACSIALRNAVFKGVPKAFWGSIYESAKKTAIGDAKSLASKRDEMVAYFAKMGVGLDRILAAVNCPSLEDIGADELAVLKGTANTIKDGEVSVDEAFPTAEKKREPEDGARANTNQADDLTAQLKASRGAPTADAEATKPATEAASKSTREPGEEDVTEEDQQRVKLEELFDAIAEKESKAFASDTLENAKRDDGKLIGKRLPGKVRVEDLDAGIKALQEKCRQLGI